MTVILTAQKLIEDNTHWYTMTQNTFKVNTLSITCIMPDSFEDSAPTHDQAGAGEGSGGGQQHPD